MEKIGLATAIAFLLAAPLARADVINAPPVVWHITSPSGGNVTLFGSLHILPANMDWLTPDIMHAVSRTDMFVFEVPTDPSSEETLNGMISARGTLPPGQSLRSLL